MNHSLEDTEQNRETLEHLLGVVVESREQRCKQVREKACEKAQAIIDQAYGRSRARLHSHVIALREKYRVRVSSARARNQTLLRQQHQKDNRAVLDVAWLMLRESMLEQWQAPKSRRGWLAAAIAQASTTLRGHGWHVEHPPGLDEDELKQIRRQLASVAGKGHKMAAKQDIEAGIRIISHGTVIDATLQGLLANRARIEAELIARIKRGGDADE